MNCKYMKYKYKYMKYMKSSKGAVRMCLIWITESYNMWGTCSSWTLKGVHWFTCSFLLFVSKDNYNSFQYETALWNFVRVNFINKRAIYTESIQKISVSNRRKRSLHNFPKALFTSTDMSGNFGLNIFVIFFSFGTARVEPCYKNHLK